MFEEKFTNLIIAGVNKGGTTSLFSVMARHPEICGSAIKETGFFLPLRYNEQREPESVYDGYFSGRKNETYLLESTPGYMYGGQPLIENVIDLLGKKTRVVVVLREPVARVVSFFRFKKTMLELPADLAFEDYINQCLVKTDSDLKRQEENVWFGVEGGRYAAYLEPWLETFGDNIRVVFFDDLNVDLQSVLSGLFQWLEVEDLSGELGAGHERQNVTSEIKNRSLQGLALGINKKFEIFFRRNTGVKSFLKKMYYKINASGKKEDIPKQQIERLQSLYREDNRALRSLLEKYGYKQLPGWLEGEAA